MQLLAEILSYLFNVFFSLFCMLILIRFYMQVVKASFINPIGQGIIKLTNWIVLPLQSILPKTKSFDLPSLVGAYLCSLIHLLTSLFIQLLLTGMLDKHDFFTLQGVIYLLSWSILNLVKLSAYVLTALIFVRIIFSWIQPNTPSSFYLRRFFEELSEPLVRPVRRLLPRTGIFDFSPFIIILLLQIVLMIVNYFMRY